MKPELVPNIDLVFGKLALVLFLLLFDVKQQIPIYIYIPPSQLVFKVCTSLKYAVFCKLLDAC